MPRSVLGEEPGWEGTWMPGLLLLYLGYSKLLPTAPQITALTEAPCRWPPGVTEINKIDTGCQGLTQVATTRKSCLGTGPAGPWVGRCGTAAGWGEGQLGGTAGRDMQGGHPLQAPRGSPHPLHSSQKLKMLVGQTVSTV